jgi:hypothetical protein
MSNPQEPEMRRSEETAVTETNPEKERAAAGRSHGTDKGGKGGGNKSPAGDTRPPDQSPPHPS